MANSNGSTKVVNAATSFNGNIWDETKITLKQVGRATKAANSLAVDELALGGVKGLNGLHKAAMNVEIWAKVKDVAVLEEIAATSKQIITRAAIDVNAEVAKRLAAKRLGNNVATGNVRVA